MLLIPGYPYFVAFIYTCLSVFFIFLQGRENRDILFTVSPPVSKRDIVKDIAYYRSISLSKKELLELIDLHYGD